MYQYDKYRKFLLNRMTSSPEITEHIENSLITEDEMAKHSFHKIMVCKWPERDVPLFETLHEYFGNVFIPINFSETNLVTSFYTNSLMLVLKIMKMDFMFPYCRNMFSVDILLNDKTSSECFGEKVTVDDLITYVVSHRFNEHRELDLSNFCNDPVFKEKKIHFYKLSLLSHFKILMIRMGRDTRILNLSSNNLKAVPLDILNFFIKGDMIGVNLSNNDIPSVAELQRISSKIEKLWVEGNPLCEDVMDPVTYIRQISHKFPRLNELDGVQLNDKISGIVVPFHKNFLIKADKRTKMVVERFVTLFFAHYDNDRKKLKKFYDTHVNMTIMSDFPVVEPLKANTDPYVILSRNFLNPIKQAHGGGYKQLYRCWDAVQNVYRRLPQSAHDLSTFNIDVLQHDNKSMILTIDGLFKERPQDSVHDRILQFRRTFIMHHAPKKFNNTISAYWIAHEMFFVTMPSPEIAQTSFQKPIRNIIQLTLIDPDSEDKKTMCNIFTHLTNLRKNEAEARLLQYDWDISMALRQFINDFKGDMISPDKFAEEDDDFSDLSSLLDEID